MADNKIILPDDSANTGPKLDTSSLTVGANTVHRERMNIADPTTDVALAAVTSSAPTTEYGLVTRAAGATKVSQYDGTNTETVLFDADSGAGSQYVQGVSIRKAASGGSVEYGTSSDPLRVDPTGTTTQPVSLASVPSHAVTNAGTFAVQESGAALTALQLIDNPVVVDDAGFTPATTSVMMAGFEFDDVAPDSVNEGDAGAARMSANRNIYTTIRDAAGNERGVNVNASNQLSVSVDNTVTVGSHAVTNAGTFAVQESGAALTSLQLIDDTVYTDDTSTHSTGTSKGLLLMAAATPTDTAVNANDIGALAMTVNRELLIQVNTALPAGTNAIGKLAANSGVDIGDVDVTSVIAGTGATNLGKAEDAAHTTGDTGVMMLGVRKDTAAATAGTDGDYQPPVSNARGATWVAIEDGAGGQITSFGGGIQYTEDVAAAADPVGTTPILVRKDTPAAITSADGDNIAQRGTDYGAAYVTILNSSGTPINTFGGSGGTAVADDAAFAVGTDQGTPAMGLADETATDSVDEGDVGVMRMTLDRKQIVAIYPHTAGGCSMYHKVSAASDNAANVKASAGQVYGISIYNNAGYPVYVKLHNTAGTPTAGAGVVRAFGCQAGVTVTYNQANGMAFGTGIGITIVKDITDAGTTAVALSDCVVGIEYK